MEIASARGNLRLKLSFILRREEVLNGIAYGMTHVRIPSSVFMKPCRGEEKEDAKKMNRFSKICRILRIFV